MSQSANISSHLHVVQLLCAQSQTIAALMQPINQSRGQRRKSAFPTPLFLCPPAGVTHLPPPLNWPQTRVSCYSSIYISVSITVSEFSIGLSNFISFLQITDLWLDYSISLQLSFFHFLISLGLSILNIYLSSQ